MDMREGSSEHVTLRSTLVLPQDGVALMQSLGLRALSSIPTAKAGENNKVSTFENRGGGTVCPTDLIQIVSTFPHFVRLYYSSSWEILHKAFHIH